MIPILPLPVVCMVTISFLMLNSFWQLRAERLSCERCLKTSRNSSFLIITVRKAFHLANLIQIPSKGGQCTLHSKKIRQENYHWNQIAGVSGKSGWESHTCDFITEISRMSPWWTNNMPYSINI